MLSLKPEKRQTRPINFFLFALHEDFPISKDIVQHSDSLQ